MRSAAATLMIIVLTAASAAAQGNGNAHALGRYKHKSNPPPSASSTTAAPSAESVPVVGGVRQFGSWLDDASLVEPAHGYASISIGHYRSLGGRQTDFPIVDGAFGLTPRLQVGVSVPYYRLTFNDGTRITGLGDPTASGSFIVLPTLYRALSRAAGRPSPGAGRPHRAPPRSRSTATPSRPPSHRRPASSRRRSPRAPRPHRRW